MQAKQSWYNKVHGSNGIWVGLCEAGELLHAEVNVGCMVVNSIKLHWFICVTLSVSDLFVWFIPRFTLTAYLYNRCLAWYNAVITSRVDLSMKYSQQLTVTAVDSCNCGISVLNHCLSWWKFVNTHLSHSRQWFNIHLLVYQSYYCILPVFHVCRLLSIVGSFKSNYIVWQEVFDNNVKVCISHEVLTSINMYW